MLRSILALVGLLLAVAGFAAFLAVVGGAWWLRGEVNRQAGYAADKARQGADVADRGVRLVRVVLAEARADLAASQLAHHDAPVANPVFAVVARQAATELVGDMTRAELVVGAASDAVVLAHAALDAVGDNQVDFPGLALSPDRVATARGQLDGAAGELRRARSVLGLDPNGGLSPGEASAVRRALDDADRLAGELDREIDRARAKVDALQQRVTTWTLRGALAVTALGVLGAVGQVCLGRCCWRTLTGPPVRSV